MALQDQASKRGNYRIFAEAGIAVSVKVGIGGLGDRRWRELPIDATTGIIQIPDIHLYAPRAPHIKLPGEIDPPPGEKVYGPPTVRAFELEVSHLDGDDPWVVVTSRDADNQYKRELPGFGSGEKQTYHFPECSVALIHRNAKLREAEHSCGEKAVFTTPKSQSGDRGTNRIDVWVFKKNGFIGLFQVLVTTFDDGATFQMVGSWRGQWRIRRLPAPRAYKPQYSPVDKRRQEQQAVFNTPKVAKVLDKIIFVPDGSCTGFDNRIELLQNNKVLDYIEDNLAGFAEWTETTADGETIRNFSIRPDVEGVKLEGNRGILQFFTHGLSGCGWGIVTGADGKERQVKYHCFASDTSKDEQGLLQVLDGDVVEWDKELDMGVNAQKEPYPKLLVNARVQMVNVARRRAIPVVDSTSNTSAAA